MRRHTGLPWLFPLAIEAGAWVCAFEASTSLAEAVRRGHITSNPTSIARPQRIPEEERSCPSLKKRQRRSSRRRGPCATARGSWLLSRSDSAEDSACNGAISTSRGGLTVRRSITRLTWKHGCPEDQPCGRRYAGHCPQKHGGGAVAGEVKSSAGRCTVGIPDPLVQVLEEHRKREQRERELAADLWQEEDRVFTNQRGGPVHPKVDHDAWKELLRKAEVRDARLHDARHTAATTLLLLDVPSRAVTDVMAGRRPR